MIMFPLINDILFKHYKIGVLRMGTLSNKIVM